MAVEQCLLLIGSSHFTRLQDYIHHSPEAANGMKYLFVSRGGLTAAEGLDFVMRHDAQIARFSPTHAVIHLGGNDVMNREQKLPLGNFGQAIKSLKALGAWLVAQYNVEVHYSEFLPHARYPCPQGQKLPDWMFERNKFWLNYNRMVAQARNNRYSNIGSIVFHPQMWDGIKNAKLEFYETEHFRKWWGLHLNNGGRELMWGNIMKIFDWTQDVQLFQALLRATTISKEII